MPQIVFNKEYFESMSCRFEGVFEEIDTASQFAFRADKYISMWDLAVKSIENLRSIIRNIIDSFSSTDQELKEQAESILGVDVHQCISSGGQVTINEDGSYRVEDYSRKVQNYIHENLDHLLSINASNRTIWLRDGDWCDAYVDYILKQSGVPSPGDTNNATTTLFEMNDWRHGYKFDNGDWSEFNNYTPTPGGARISNDGYQSKTGDLVWGSGYLATEHVGIYYVDPVTKLEYVLEGNVPDTNLTPAQQFYDRYRHVSFGDIGAYVNSLNN